MFVLYVFSNILLTIIPLFIGRLVGEASKGLDSDTDIWRYVGILIFCSIGHDLSWRTAEIMYLKYINPLTYRYETGVFKQVIAEPYPYFVGKFTGKIASYVASLGKEFHDLINTFMYNYTAEFVRVISITLLLFSVNLLTGLIFVIGMLCMVLAGRYTIRNSITYEAKLTDVESTKNGIIIDIVSNFANVKSFHKEQAENHHVAVEQEKVIAAATRSFTWALFFWGSMSFFIRYLIWPVTIALNVHFYLRGIISIAELTTLLSTILLFSNYVWEFIWYVSQFNLKLARIEEAHRYLFGKRSIEVLRGDVVTAKMPNLTLDKALTIKGLKFSYPDRPEHDVLQGIDLEIKRGEKIGIVGKSGGGKTTLVKVLLGYYDAYQGDIVLDGAVRSSAELLSIISYVPQDATLFNRTIHENIAYATDRQVQEQEVQEVSKKALADEFIEKIPHRYRAIVGERGVKLSTGQRQRIAIARAMLQDKPLLILDEATSALDSENEMLIQKSLENLWQDRTVISIAHRLSTLKKMDRILVIDGGRIVEQGTITDLLKQKGIFSELWNHQTNGMIID